jgi:hypothetical protein
MPCRLEDVILAPSVLGHAVTTLGDQWTWDRDRWVSTGRLNSSSILESKRCVQTPNALKKVQVGF